MILTFLIIGAITAMLIPAAVLFYLIDSTTPTIKVVLYTIITILFVAKILVTGAQAGTDLKALTKSQPLQKNEIIVCEAPTQCNVYFELRK